MALTVATNTGALMAQAAASSVNKEMEISMERLSTGKRINGAADDAAGVAIASRLTAEIKGTNQAIRNAMDGQALIDTAEGAHQEVEVILQRMRELAVQSANDTNDATDRSNLQSELDQLTAEINRISATTSWAGQALLDGTGGSSGTFTFQVGSKGSTNDQLAISIDSIDAATLGVGAGTVATAAGAATLTAIGDSVIQVEGAPATGDVFTFTVNGEDATHTATASSTAATVATAMANAINALGQPGVAATADSDGSVTLEQPINFSSASATIAADASAASAVTTTDFTQIDFDVAGIAAGDKITFTVGNVTHSSTMVTTDAYADSTAGFAAQVQAELDALATLEGLDVTVTDNAGSLEINFDTATTFTGAVSINATTSALDITSQSSSASVIATIDTAINTINSQRAELGSYSNRLDSTVSNLTNISANLQAGRGRIEDADFAAETTTLAKTQILQQASTAMLAQANASKQNVLSLLQG
jgi:flagellin